MAAEGATGGSVMIVKCKSQVAGKVQGLLTLGVLRGPEPFESKKPDRPQILLLDEAPPAGLILSCSPMHPRIPRAQH